MPAYVVALLSELRQRCFAGSGIFRGVWRRRADQWIGSASGSRIKKIPTRRKRTNTNVGANSANCKNRMPNNPNRPNHLRSINSRERVTSVSTTSRMMFLIYMRGVHAEFSPGKLPGTDLGQTSWHGPRG